MTDENRITFEINPLWWWATGDPAELTPEAYRVTVLTGARRSKLVE
jgi:hypothetical protein